MKNEKNDLKSLMCPGFDQAVSAGEEDGVALADLLVGDSLEAKVTDIHLDPQGDLYRIKFRVGGQLYPVAELPREAGEQLVRSIEVEGVYDILRHDPDALFLGEIRDQETAHAAVNASFSGHVVLSTMHSRDPASVITLLRSMGAADYEIAASISLVIGQRILSRLCPECRVRREPHGFEKTAARKHGVVLQAAWDAQGCSACAGTGQRGLTAVFELWRLEEADHEAILDHADEKTLRSRIRERGVPSLATAAIERAAAGKIRMDQALALL